MISRGLHRRRAWRICGTAEHRGRTHLIPIPRGIGDKSLALRRATAGRHRRIADPAVIERILEHLGRDAESVDPTHPSRAPPQGSLSL